MYHILGIYSSVDGYLECSYFLKIVNRTAVNMNNQVSLEEDIESFGFMLKTGMPAY